MNEIWFSFFQFFKCSSPRLPVGCFLALLHTSSMHAHTRKLTTFPSDCWAQPWAFKSWCKHHFLSVDKKGGAELEEGEVHKEVVVEEKKEEEEEEERRAKKRGSDGESCAKAQLVWLGCLSESKMGDRDWEKDERQWEGTVEEEEAYYSEAESRSVTNGNTRWLICLSQWQKPEIWVREIWYRT